MVMLSVVCSLVSCDDIVGHWFVSLRVKGVVCYEASLASGLVMIQQPSISRLPDLENDSNIFYIFSAYANGVSIAFGGATTFLNKSV